MYDEDIDTESTTVVTLADLRAAAPCLCMSCWGETDQVICSIDFNNTRRNMAMLKAHAKH